METSSGFCHFTIAWTRDCDIGVGSCVMNGLKVTAKGVVA